MSSYSYQVSSTEEAQALMEFAQRQGQADREAQAAYHRSLSSHNALSGSFRTTLRDGQATTESLGVRSASATYPHKDRVTVHGIETSRDAAEILGWHEEDHGPFTAAPAEGASAGPGEDSHTEGPTPAQEQVNAFFERVEQAGYSREDFSADAGEVFDNYGPTPDLTRRVAERLGLSYAEASNAIAQAGREFQAQVNREIEALGIDPGAAFALVGHDAARAAMIDYATGNPTTVLRLVEDAKRELLNLPEFDPETFRRITKGMNVRTGYDGEVVLTVPGYGEVTWRAAVTNGWVKVRG